MMLFIAIRWFTFFSGNLLLDTLPVSLKIAGIKFNEVKVYVTKLTPVAVPGPFDAVLFYSPSGVESFLANNTIGNAVCICIGDTTARAIKNPEVQMVIAAKPSIENVIIRCIKHFVTSDTKK